MLILFDNGTPAPLRTLSGAMSSLKPLNVARTRLVNGDLIAAAEASGFELLLTTDKNMRYQPNRRGRQIALSLSAISNGRLCAATVEKVVAAANAATPGSSAEVEIR